MVRKFVYVPGDEPRLAPRNEARVVAAPAPNRSGAKLMQWLLIAAALAVSAVGFSMAESSSSAGEVTQVH